MPSLNLNPAHKPVAEYCTDDHTYVVRLLGQVITVRLETGGIVRALPELGIAAS